jgi:DNA-binding NarL/FixJ family response regulator
MEEMTGLEAAKAILKQDKDAKVLFLTTFSDDEYIIEALRLGAKGYLLKQDFESVIPALKAVYSGQTIFGADIGLKLPTLLQRNAAAQYDDLGITPKERKIIELVAKGLSNKEISDHLYLSEGTVRNYLSTILDKLELRDRTQLAIHYYQRL